MRLLHTSDWHLGRALYGRRRHEEFQAFLDWLIDAIDQHGVDALLLAGDVFDTPAPSTRTQAQYYRFLHRVAATRCRHVVIIAGNHDSPTFLDAPRALLGAMGVHVVGQAPEEPGDEVITLRNAQGEPELIVCAVPYLRERDLRQAEPGETPDDKARKLAQGMARRYAQVLALAGQQRRALAHAAAAQGQPAPWLPIVAMGHLFTAGGQTVDGDGVRELYVGTLAHVDARLFDPAQAQATARVPKASTTAPASAAPAPAPGMAVQGMPATPEPTPGEPASGPSAGEFAAQTPRRQATPGAPASGPAPTPPTQTARPPAVPAQAVLPGFAVDERVNDDCMGYSPLPFDDQTVEVNTAKEKSQNPGLKAAHAQPARAAQAGAAGASHATGMPVTGAPACVPDAPVATAPNTPAPNTHVPDAPDAPDAPASAAAAPTATAPDALAPDTPAPDYVALGHLHVPQAVDGMPHIRYSGSPIPMGFGEAGQRKSVCLVDLALGAPAQVQLLPVPVFQALVRVQGDWPAIEQQVQALQTQAPTAWLEVVYTGTELLPELTERVRALVAGSTLAVLRIQNERSRQRQQARLQADAQNLSDLSVDDVFERCLAAHDVPEAQRPELRQTHREAVHALQEAGVAVADAQPPHEAVAGNDAPRPHHREAG